MNLKTEQTGAVAIVRVGETRLMYPILSDFSSAVATLVAAGTRNILIDRQGRVHWKRTGGDPFTDMEFLLQTVKRMNGEPVVGSTPLALR